MSQLATPIRKNDTVLIITGKDRGKRGRVLKVLPDKNRLIVEGMNLIKRHTRPNPGKNIKGGIVEREASLHASNAQLVCPECGAQTRVGRKILGDGRKVRVCRLIMLTPSTINRFLPGTTFSTRPRLPLSLPVFTDTVSFFRIGVCRRDIAREPLARAK